MLGEALWRERAKPYLEYIRLLVNANTSLSGMKWVDDLPPVPS